MNMRILVSKLPFRLRNKCQLMVVDIAEQLDCRTRFKDLLDFLEEKISAALDPVFWETQSSK